MISPQIKNGTTIPVEALLSKTWASINTTIIKIPLIPDLESPTIKTATAAKANEDNGNWNCSGKVIMLVIDKSINYEFK